MTEYLLRLPWPPAELHSNSRAHWAQKARAAKEYKHAAWALAKKQYVTRMPAARIEFTYCPPDRRRRDAQNMPAALKAAIDGIALAMRCDDHGFQCLFPMTFAEPVNGGAVLAHIKPGGVE